MHISSIGVKASPPTGCSTGLGLPGGSTNVLPIFLNNSMIKCVSSILKY